MTLREMLDQIKKSEIYKLRVDNTIIGLRVKSFNVNTCQFEYYDFELDIIHNQGVQNFINSIHNSLNTVDLIRHNGLLVSQEELNGQIKVGNFNNEADAIRVLYPFIKIYRYKNNG